MNQGLRPYIIRPIALSMRLISRRTRIWKNDDLKVIRSKVMAKISKNMNAKNYAKVKIS